MTKILVVDDMAVFREPIAASLRLAGYEAMCAENGKEALKLTSERQPDLIVLEVAMPKMDGITFLKKLRADARFTRTRVMVLTALGEKKYVLAAASFGVRDYLLKSRFRLADLLERIKKGEGENAFAAPTAPATANTAVQAPSQATTGAAMAPIDFQVPRLFSAEQFLLKVESVFQVKSLSGVVAQVIALSNSPRGDMAQLASLILRDPMLSARVLQAANSAAYSSRGAVVTTVPEAIRKVGCTTVRNLAAALGVIDSMPAGDPDGFNPIRCWQHSFAVAQLCESLVGTSSAHDASLAYVVGLCHDLCDIFIRTHFASEFQQLLDAVAKTGRPREQLQREMFGLTYSQMIGAIFKCIALPDAIREPIEMFHSSAASRATHPLARILWMAENYANGALLASAPNSQVSPLTQTFCRAAVEEKNPMAPDPQSLRSEVLTLTLSLARLSRTDEAKLLVPMFDASSAKVWLARGPGISEFDPVATALKSLADVVIQPRLPMGGETEEIDGLVAIAPSGAMPGFGQPDIERVFAKRRVPALSIPVLAITVDETTSNSPADSLPWHTSIALSELATFVEKLKERDCARAVA